MKSQETLLLKRGDVAALLSLDECIAAVEQAFKLYAEGQTLPPGVLGVHARDGGFHIKALVITQIFSFADALAVAERPYEFSRAFMVFEY
jgi:ornithine cyclodeaminase/alanine dehydrogenase-like protein (mu-crystallin family)